jgi:hypothetical protein
MVKRCLFLALLLPGCAPELDDTSELVSEPQVLAVRATPPEAKAGTAVRYEALYATPAGPSPASDLDWGYCTERKPLTEQGPVAPDCLVASGSTVAPVGRGLAVQGSLPANACRVFGPDRPEPKKGEPPGRPADPDVTGGYYQPLRLRIPSLDRYTTTATRVACGISGVTQEQLAYFTQNYVPNENPVLSGVSIGGVEAVADTVVPVKANSEVALEARWASTESYLVFDPSSRTFATKTETMRVSWFVTGGNVAAPSGGRVGGDPTLAVGTSWTTPAPGDAWLWVVLRDDRGGTDWRSVRLRVE